MRLLAALSLVALVLCSCSKENDVDASIEVLGVGQQCSGQADQGCGEGSKCVLGFCRHGCTNDPECPQGSICIGTREPYGCAVPSELACSDPGQPCTPPLVCGLDGSCRLACEADGDCPRNEHRCIAGTCVGESETSDAAERLRECETGLWQCIEGELRSCNLGVPGLAIQEQCVTAQLCQPGTAGECVEPACDPGVTCTGATMTACNHGRTAFTTEECASAAVCEATQGFGTCSLDASPCLSDLGELSLECAPAVATCAEDAEWAVCALAGSSGGCTSNAAFVALVNCTAIDIPGTVSCTSGICASLDAPCDAANPCCSSLSCTNMVGLCITR